MAKIRSPLFSVGASGTVGRKLTFRRTANGALAQATPTPTGPPTSAQLYERNRVREAADLWRTMDAPTKAIWRNLGTLRNVNPWLIFCNEYKTQLTVSPELPLIPG